MGVDFLGFLRSGEKDIRAFAENRQGRTKRQNDPKFHAAAITRFAATACS
jgi:hypothetical protein